MIKFWKYYACFFAGGVLAKLDSAYGYEAGLATGRFIRNTFENIF